MPRFVCSDCDAEYPVRRRPVVALPPGAPLHQRSSFAFEDENGDFAPRVHHGWPTGSHYPVMKGEVLPHLGCQGTWSYKS